MRRMLFVLAVATLTLAACGEKRDPMRMVIDSAVAAAESRDTDALGGIISSTYTDSSEQSREVVLQTVRRYFAAYKSIDLSVSNLEVEDHSTFMGATFTVDFSGTPAIQGGLSDYLPRTSRWEFWIEIEKEGDAWRIVWAEWKELERVGIR